MFNIWDADNGTTGALVLASMGVTKPGDSLRFDHAYATYTGEIDRLFIEISSDGGTSYTDLVVLNGGSSGPLVTAPATMAEFVPTATQWATKRYALPAGVNRVRFKAVSGFGNNIFIDNCRIGSQLTNDAGMQSIDLPRSFTPSLRLPTVTVRNHGAAPASLTVTLLISPDGYTSVKTVAGLPGDATATVHCDDWIPGLGTHTLTAFTSLAGDADPSNDTVRLVVEVKQAQQVQNISATSKFGQVFVTWDNLPSTNNIYTLYRSASPIQHGNQLPAAQCLGSVRDNSALNRRLTELSGGVPKYLKIDSASAPIVGTKGLFVATSTASGSFYYAVTTMIGGVEDTTVVTGQNVLASPVTEALAMPQPVWQEARVIDGKTFDIYVQYVTKVASTIYPQMTTAGSYPFHFALIKSGSQALHPMTFWMHGSGGNFLPGASDLRTIGDPNEWVVTIDDCLPESEYITFYYGYSELYDMLSDQNRVPTSGILCNYTSARVAHTVDWVIRHLPVDSTRTYMAGFSMGATGSLLNGFVIPSKIAAILVFAPRLELSTWGEYTLWGGPLQDLLTNEGYHKRERLSATFLAGVHRSDYLPIMYTFCGKTDGNVGWAEKPPFYDSLNAYRHGGVHFWGMTNHTQTFYTSPWQASFPNFSFFIRYRTNLSYPAFSNCSLNGNPGNGDPTNGYSIGTINGLLDWNDDIVDTPKRWEITLKTISRANVYGTVSAPDSGTTDVTLRRLQRFAPPMDSMITWSNIHGGMEVQGGSFQYAGGPITIPGMKVFKDGGRLTVRWVSTGIEDAYEVPAHFALEQNYPNPFNPKTTIAFVLPTPSDVRLSVFDVLGREVSVLVNEKRGAGIHQAAFDGSDHSSGVYFYRIQARPLGSLLRHDAGDPAGIFVRTKAMVLVK